MNPTEDRQNFNISSETIAGSPSEFAIPEAPQQTDPRAVIGAIPSIDTLLQRFQTPSAAETTQSALQQRILGALEGLGEQEAVQLAEEEERGIPEQQRRLQELSGQLEQLQAESLGIPLQVQEEFVGRGVTTGGIQPIETARLRRNAIKSLSVGAQAQALAGNISLAQQQADRAVDLEFEPLEQELQILQQLYTFNKDELNRIDSKRATELQVQLDNRRFLLDAQKEDRTSQNQLALTLAQSGLDTTGVLGADSYGDALREALPSVTRLAEQGRIREELLSDLDLEMKRVSLNNARIQSSLLASELLATSNSDISEDEREAETEKALGIFTLASQVAGMEGLSSAIGFGFKKSVVGAIPFVSGEAVAGSARADFEAQAKRLANMLTLDNLKLMSGVLSETDIKILESAGSNLGNFNISEEAYKEELSRVIRVAQRNYTRLGISQEQAQFWFGLDEQDLSEADDLYTGTPTAAGILEEFNPSNFY